MSDNNFNLSINVDAPHPMAALSAIDEIISTIDATVAKFSNSKDFIHRDDLPLLMWGANTDVKEPYYYNVSISNTNNNDSKLLNHPAEYNLFYIGQPVHHFTTGKSYRIRSKAYYAVAQSWFYACVDSNNEVHHLNHSELINSTQWSELHLLLSKATESTWTYKDDICMFVNDKNKSRKLRLDDARHAIRTFETGEEAPF